jgi:hypothetical protein
MEWTEQHQQMANNRRIAQLYFNDRFAQMACESALTFCDWVDRINAEAQRVEDARRTEIYYKQQEKLKAENQIKPPPPGAPGALGVAIDPVKPITPAGEALKLVEPTQHLEIPAHRVQVPYYEVQKEYLEVKQKAFEIKPRIIAYEKNAIEIKKSWEIKKEIPFQKDKGITIS